MKRSMIAVVGALMLASCASVARTGTKVVGCYAASPALTYDRSGIPALGDSSFALVQLMRGGRATRPLVRKGPMPIGTWRFVADTLQIVVADGYTGWSLLVRSDNGVWIGHAWYISDVLLVGEPPYHHAIALRPRECVSAG